MIELVALKAHTPDGSRYFRVGDVFSMSEPSAKLLIATGYARLHEPAATVEVETATPEAEPKRREHKRRDMKAES